MSRVIRDMRMSARMSTSFGKKIVPSNVGTRVRNASIGGRRAIAIACQQRLSITVIAVLNSIQIKHQDLCLRSEANAGARWFFEARNEDPKKVGLFYNDTKR